MWKGERMHSERVGEQEPGQGNLLRFVIGPYQFCLSALEVVAIITPPRLTVLPLSAVDVVGVFSYQRQIVTCIDLRQKFTLKVDPDKHSGELLLGHVGEMLVAFWVDHVTDIVASETMRWSPLPPLQANNNVFSSCNNDTRACTSGMPYCTICCSHTSSSSDTILRLNNRLRCMIALK